VQHRNLAANVKRSGEKSKAHLQGGSSELRSSARSHASTGVQVERPGRKPSDLGPTEKSGGLRKKEGGKKNAKTERGRHGQSREGGRSSTGKVTTPHPQGEERPKTCQGRANIAAIRKEITNARHREQSRSPVELKTFRPQQGEGGKNRVGRPVLGRD